MLTDSFWLCQWSASYTPAASYTPTASYSFVAFNSLLGTHIQAGVLVVTAGHRSGFAGFLYMSRSSLSKILFEIVFGWLHLSLFRRQHIPQCDNDRSLHLHKHLLGFGTCIFLMITLKKVKYKLGMNLLWLRLDRCFLALSKYKNKPHRIIR